MCLVLQLLWKKEKRDFGEIDSSFCLINFRAQIFVDISVIFLGYFYEMRHKILLLLRHNWLTLLTLFLIYPLDNPKVLNSFFRGKTLSNLFPEFMYN